jgi:hypothetical protein
MMGPRAWGCGRRADGNTLSCFLLMMGPRAWGCGSGAAIVGVGIEVSVSVSM